MPTEFVAYALILYVVPAINPAIELEKFPKPEPSVVLVSEIVGVEFVELQQTPLEVTSAPPSVVTVPPDEAEFAVMLVIADAVSVGITFGVSFLQVIKTVKSSPINPILIKVE